jgi:hypothetical protein
MGVWIFFFFLAIMDNVSLKFVDEFSCERMLSISFGITMVWIWFTPAKTSR